MALNVSGIPDVRVRVDDSEEAREWNKLRGAVLSLFNKAHKRGGVVIGPQRFGFRPIGLRHHQDSESLEEFPSGVGISPGQLRFLQTQRITSSLLAENNAVEIYPTIGSTTIDNTDPTPRESLGDGDWEAWVIFKEIGTTNEARISFQTLDVGPGSMDRDEKAVRLCSFSVLNKEDTNLPPRIYIYEQNVKDSLAVWTDRHQFRVRKTEADKVKVEKGFVVWQKGPSYPLVSESFEVDESAEIDIPGVDGSIWLSMNFGTAQHSTSTQAIAGTSGAGTCTITNHRLDSLSSANYTFRAAAPTRGVDTTSIFSTGDLWYEIAKIVYGADEAFVSEQIINGPIYVNELSDSKLSP